MALSPDRGKLLTYDESGTLTLWELSTGRVLLVREDCESAIGDNSTFAFLSGDRFAYEDQSGSVMICDMETGETSLFLEKALPSELTSDPGGNYLAVKSFGQIRVYAGDSLAALDQEQDRLIVGGRNGKQYAISIYSPEELLAKAQPGVLY